MDMWMQQEVLRREQEQKAEQVVPAAARADAVAVEADGVKRKEITLAEGERQRLTLTAEGEKNRLSLTADGSADKIRKEGTAEADIIQLKGEAEAYAIRAKGLAEAEAMEKKAAAWEKYGRAAVTELIVEKLPEIVGEASRAIQNTDKIIVMGEGGPSLLVKSAVDIAAQAPTLIKALTGMELGDLAIKLKELQR